MSILIEKFRKKVLELFNSETTVIQTILIGFPIFLFSFWLISRNNGFFSGDMGIMGLMIDDMSKGNFHSWYFYGQNYFGNLEPFLLVPLTFITGNTINSLYFWEYFFYFISITFLIFSWEKRTNIQTFLTYLILIFGIRHIFHFTYFPQGFAFVGMIISGFYLLFKKISTHEIKINKWHFFITAFFTTLSLWHNLLVAIIAPIFGIIILWNLFSKKYNKLNVRDILFGILGLLIGLIPFGFATLQMKGENLGWFIDNTDSDKLYSIYYVGRDFLFYFLNPSTIDDTNWITIAKGIFLQPRNLAGIIFLLSAIILILKFSIKKHKEFINLSLFLVFLMLLMVVKDYTVGSHVFYHIRYAVPFYTIFIFLITSLSFRFIKEKQNGVFIKFLSAYCLIFLLALVPITIYKRFKEANSYPQFYENVLKTVVDDYKATNIYCDNYYDVCGTVAYLGKDLDFNVQMINTSDSNADRNPRAKFKVDNALRNGEYVMSLIRKDKLKDEHLVLEEFCMAPGAPVYYLIEGDYK